MSKLAIFSKNAVETLEFFSRQLADTFERRGYEVFWLDFKMLGLGVWKLRQAVKGKEAVFITFNFIGYSGEEELWEPDGDRMTGFWEKEGIRCLNIIVDHPMYYYQQLRMASPDWQMQVFCIDRDHAAYMARFYPKVPCAFLPSAGNAPQPARDLPPMLSQPLGQWAMRPYPVVFIANYVPVANIEKQLDRLEPEYRAFYYEIIDAFVHHPEKELLSLIEEYIRREIPDVTEGGLCMAMHTMVAVDLWIRTYFREKAVRALAEGGVKVYLFGKDWERIPCQKPENLISNGHMANSLECVRAVGQGQIALNTMPWFKDGAHDRIFTAMLQGAVAFTDDSRYLREQFDDGDALVYYDLHNMDGMAQQVGQLLREPERLYAIACRGYAAAVKGHTWEQRAETLFRYFDKKSTVEESLDDIFKNIVGILPDTGKTLEE